MRKLFKFIKKIFKTDKVERCQSCGLESQKSKTVDRLKKHCVNC